MNNIPDISSFQYDRMANGHLESSVNMYRGAVCFHYNLIELPKQENVGISINASYNSDIDKNLTQSNLVSPTGVMGLGWRLTYEKIECNKEDIGKSPACREYRLTTGDNPGGGAPLHLIEEKDGCLYFENEICDYSEIVYDCMEEEWIVTKADGIRYLYGGGQNLQYAVLNGGRYCEAGCTDEAEQSRNVKAWNLSAVGAPGGFTVKYEYDFIEQSVTGGSVTYTKAAYLKKISDSYGNAALFRYEDKTWTQDRRNAREYEDPHKENPSDQPDFYQSEYETKYLSRIVVCNQQNELYSVRFAYELVNYASVPPIMGDTVKRMLTEIQMVTKQGELPAMQFFYNAKTDRNAGALCKIVYPEGGFAAYTYGQQQQLTMSDRSRIISNNGFSEPLKTFFGKDYAVILQRNAGKAVLSVYEWIGRWQRYTPDVSLDGFDAGTIEVYTMERYCVLKGILASGTGAGYIVLTRRRKVKGGWKVSKTESVRTPYVKIITGDEWFLVYRSDNNTVADYDYDGRCETWEEGGFLEKKGEVGYTRMFCACRNRLLCFAYDERGGGKQNKITLFERDPLYVWKKLAETSDSSIMLQGGKKGDFSLAFDGFLAAGAFVREKTATHLRYTFGVWRLAGKDTFKQEIMEDRPIPVEDCSYITPRICGNTVICAGYLYRFCGNTWKGSKELAITREGNYQFAFAEDIALCSCVTETMKQIKGALFDKERNTWKVRTLLQAQGDYAKEPFHGVSISGNIAVCGDKVYDITERTFDKVIEKLDSRYGSAYLFNNGVCVAGAVYNLTEEKEFKACGAYIHTFRNGQLVDRTAEKRIFDENCGGYGNILSLRDDNGDCRILFAGEGKPDKHVTFYQATGVTLHDGIEGVSRTYRYLPAYAACDETGQYARYAKVEVVSGTGGETHKTVYRYYDSVSSVSPSDNAAYSSVEDGTLVSVNAYCGGRLHNRFAASYEFTDNINGRIIYGDALAGGTLTQISEIDENGKGVERVTEFRTDLLSGEKKEVVTYNYNSRGEKEIIKRTTKFAYEKYEEMKVQHRFCAVHENIMTVNGEVSSDEKRLYALVDGVFSEKTGMLVDRFHGADKVLYDIGKRGRFGVVTEKRAVFPEYFLYDRSGCYRVAEFTNCHDGECFAYCFEAYEEPFYISAPDASVTDALCYAGSRCLEIKAGKSANSIVHHFQACGDAYGFSFYVKGKTGCSLRISGNGKTITKSVESEEFSYYLADLRELAFRKGEKAQITFTFANESDDTLFIDAIAFFPLLNPPRIHIYRDGGALLAASLSGYGDIAEPVYDDIGRAVYLLENRRKIHAQIPSLLRDTGACVNGELLMENAGSGQFVKHIAAGGEYKYSCKDGGAFFALFFCSGSLDIQNGGIRIVRRQNTWEFTDEKQHIHKSAALKGNQIAVLISEVVVLAVNGNILFSYRRKANQDNRLDDEKQPVFTLTADDDIRDLAIGEKPVAGIRFSDGAGKVRQEQYCVGGKMCVRAKCYDGMGREWADTVPTYIEGHYFEYIPDYITKIDSDTGVMHGSVSDHNPACGGYPYYSRVYEKCSGGRVLESGSPCPAYAINPSVAVDRRHTVRTSYGKDISFLPQLKDLQSYYTVMTVCDPDGNEMRTVYDLRRNKIAVAAKVGDRHLVTSYADEYKDAVRTVSVTMPGGSVRKSYYDFAGNLLGTSDVNAGEKKFFYDDYGHLRFSRDAVCDRKGLCRYRVYDQWYRVTEEGLCPLQSDEALSKQALQPSYPESGRIVSRRYYYDGSYGIEEIGRLTKIEIFDESAQNNIESVISVKADKEHLVVSRTVTIGGESYTVTERYDNLGNKISETAADGSVIEYDYDEASRIRSILKNASILTKTQYRADGLPMRHISCGNEIIYEYDGRGKMVSLDSPFYHEKVTYLEDGQYYNGKIKSLETEIKGAEGGNYPLKLKYDLLYDESGRLLSARCKEYPAVSLTDIHYDENGNILSCKSGEKERKFTIQKGSDKLTDAGDMQYRYDENGAVTEVLCEDGKRIQLERYPYSGLTKRFVITKDGKEMQCAEILYDENNRRLRKTVSGEGNGKSSADSMEQKTSCLYFYDDTKLTAQVRNGETLCYIHGGSGLTAVSRGGIDYSVITDRLGYTRVVAECQKIIQAYHYKPFGEAVEVIKKSELVNILFGNYELDAETGFYYAKSRMYDPRTYRFLSPDTEGEFPSPYLFCGNDPFAIIDENGERSWYAALIGAVIGIVLTVGLSVLTMGAAAPVAGAVFGTGGTTIAAATGAAKTAAIVAYNMAMTFTVATISGIAAEGVKSLIDGEPLTAASVYDTLLGASAAGLVFGGAGTLLSSVGKFVVPDNASTLRAAAQYAKQGMVLSLVNSGVSAALSPVSDVINGEAASGMGVLENVGFGALSGALTTFASASVESRVLNLHRDIMKETVNNIIGAVFDPSVYYSETMDIVNFTDTETAYDEYTVGTETYRKRLGEREATPIKNGQSVYEYACFGSSGKIMDPSPFGRDAHGYRNMISPRYLVTRGLL